MFNGKEIKRLKEERYAYREAVRIITGKFFQQKGATDRCKQDLATAQADNEYIRKEVERLSAIVTGLTKDKNDLLRDLTPGNGIYDLVRQFRMEVVSNQFRGPAINNTVVYISFVPRLKDPSKPNSAMPQIFGQSNNTRPELDASALQTIELITTETGLPEHWNWDKESKRLYRKYGTLPQWSEVNKSMREVESHLQDKLNAFCELEGYRRVAAGLSVSKGGK